MTQAARYVVAVAAAALFAAPLVLMASGSFRRPGAAPPTSPQLVPDPASTAAYTRAFDLVDLGRYTLNSAVVCALTVPVAVVVASWAGFAISQLPQRVRTVMVAASFAALMVPATALLVPRFALFRALGLTDTWAPLVAPALIGVSPFYVLLYAWAFSRVPRDLFDAARADGAGVLSQWGRVAMPLVRPVTAAVAVLAFAVTWGNFLDPLVYLSDERLFTLPLGLRSLAQLDRQDASVLLAGAIVATAPVVAVVVTALRRAVQPL